jgi:hypothetical protein
MKNIELGMAFTYFSSATGVGLNMDELKKLRAIRKAIKEKLTEYEEVRKSFWTSNGIENDAQLHAREDKEDLLSKVGELDNEPVEISGLNFLSEDKVIKCAPEKFNMVDIDKMIELMAK